MSRVLDFHLSEYAKKNPFRTALIVSIAVGLVGMETVNQMRRPIARLNRRKQQRLKLLLVAAYYWYRKAWKNARPRAEKSLRVRADPQRQKVHSEYHRLVQEMSLERMTCFGEYFRMSAEKFDSLLEMVKPSIAKKITNMREPISPGKRLAVTLRLLGSAETYGAVAVSYGISKSAVSKIIPETCQAIWDSLQSMFMPQPDAAMWRNVAADFGTVCQFPNCLGAIDGRHVLLKSHSISQSTFLNDEKTASVVLVAVVDARCKFLMVDIGAYGQQSDGNVFANSTLGKSLFQGLLDLPQDAAISPGGIAFPHVLVGNEAFPSKNNLLVPFPGTSLPHEEHMFNDRLSRAHRAVENAFGIVTSRFQIFKRCINIHPSHADKILKACTMLHNFLQTGLMSDEGVATLEDHAVSDGENNNAGALQRLDRVDQPPSMEAMAVRGQFMDYFNSSEGALPWQDYFKGCSISPMMS